MTEAMRKSLTILRDHGPVRPAEFARRYFPSDHPGWKRACKCGPNGSTTGSGLIMWAGGQLGKLRKLGYIRYVSHELSGTFQGYSLSGDGRKALEDAA